MSDKLPDFGKAHNAPPSFFGRVPSRATWNVRRPGKRNKNKGLSFGDYHIFSILCCYANNQGFTWPNSQTIAELAGMNRQNVTRALGRAEKLGYIEKVSKFRSHPKWRHVMGTVWRIIYDDRLDQEELIDRMNVEDPAPVLEEDLPTVDEVEASKQNPEEGQIELVEGVVVARWYSRAAEAATGQLRLVNPRAVEQAHRCLTEGLSEDQIKVRAQAVLDKCRQERQSAPEHLGFLLN
jgi:hypothetical protein